MTARAGEGRSVSELFCQYKRGLGVGERFCVRLSSIVKICPFSEVPLKCLDVFGLVRNPEQFVFSLAFPYQSHVLIEMEALLCWTPIGVPY